MIGRGDVISPGGPSIQASPETIPIGGTVTASWSGIAAPTPGDWVGLYAPGSADQAYFAWIYVSCTQTPSAAAASGSCPLAVPVNLPAGTYELRLFSNNIFARLAISTPFTTQ